MSARDRVLTFDAENPDYRIVHDGLADMADVTTGQTYQKGAWVLHMLRNLMGDEDFWTGIREYYRRYQDRNCSTDDFREVMEEVYGERLDWFFDQWLYRGGQPELDGSWNWDAATGEIEIELRQTQAGQPFRVPVTVQVVGEEGPLEATIWLEDGDAVESIPFSGDPSRVLVDPGLWLLRSGELDAVPASTLPRRNP